MEYTTLGKTGLKVSKLCLGTMSFGTPQWDKWVLDEEQSLPIIKRALELGINFFDTADVYSNGESERILGNALKKFNVPREEVVIATKCFFGVSKDPNVNTFYAPLKQQNVAGLSRKHIFHAVEDSLKRLQTDYIDLYQIHRWDYDTPIEETMEALHDLVKAGKVRYIGASSMWAYQLAKAQYYAKSKGLTQFSTMQNLYNLVSREEEREMIPTCKEFGMTLIPWSTLARGLLSGKKREQTTRSQKDGAVAFFKQLMPASDDDICNRLDEIAKEKNISSAKVAIAWLLSKQYVSAPIIGVTKVEQVEDLVGSISVKLSPEEIKSLEDPYLPHKVYSHK